jgi:hypothetical protein
MVIEKSFFIPIKKWDNIIFMTRITSRGQAEKKSELK